MKNERRSCPLELVAHPVDLLHVGEDHLGVDSVLLHHGGHVLCGEEVGHSSELLASDKSNFVVLQSVPWGIDLQGVVVKGVGEEVVDESAEGEAVGPGLGEVADVDVVVLPRPALAPDQDRLHLGAEGLLAGDPELDGETSVGGHASALGVGVEARGGVLHLLDQAGHVLEEEVVQVLLLHVLQLQHGSVLAAHHLEAVLSWS